MFIQYGFRMLCFRVALQVASGLNGIEDSVALCIHVMPTVIQTLKSCRQFPSSISVARVITKLLGKHGQI